MVLKCFAVTLKEYGMSENERSDLSNFIKKDTTDNSPVLHTMVAMMVVGGVHVLIAVVIGLVLCIKARRSRTV